MLERLKAKEEVRKKCIMILAGINIKIGGVLCGKMKSRSMLKWKQNGKAHIKLKPTTMCGGGEGSALKAPKPFKISLVISISTMSPASDLSYLNNI